jgi:2-oxoglutarate dehydrogenase E2 component (dihydrolipoamide succinyltransferase)
MHIVIASSHKPKTREAGTAPATGPDASSEQTPVAAPAAPKAPARPAAPAPEPAAAGPAEPAATGE